MRSFVFYLTLKPSRKVHLLVHLLQINHRKSHTVEMIIKCLNVLNVLIRVRMSVQRIIKKGRNLGM